MVSHTCCQTPKRIWPYPSLHSIPTTVSSISPRWLLLWMLLCEATLAVLGLIELRPLGLIWAPVLLVRRALLLVHGALLLVHGTLLLIHRPILRSVKTIDMCRLLSLSKVRCEICPGEVINLASDVLF